MNLRIASTMCFAVVSTILLVVLETTLAHDPARLAFLQAQRDAESNAEETSDRSNVENAAKCDLTIELVDAGTQKPLAGLVRVTVVKMASPLKLDGLIRRENGWYSIKGKTRIVVPQSKVKIEAIHGLETELATETIDLTSKTQSKTRLSLKRFFNAASNGLQSGNTHLHLMNLTHAEAIEYLETVPRSDGLDLVFLSHLRRIPDERSYISNAIVESDINGGGELKRLSKDGLLFANGEEHRHNFGRGGEGYGHVMLLDLTRLIRPVSIGPGIMRDGHDGISLRRGIEQARGDGATVIWCHNTFGFEDIPNWTDGLLHAQNIFDGGNHGSYQDSFYRYLNIGMRVSFSTGTDWFIYDFSRVYVPITGELTSKKWLAQLRSGRSFITNGPFLEFQVGDSQIGDTIKLSAPSELSIRGTAVGRSDFKQIELVFNGEVITTAACKTSEGHFDANLVSQIKVSEPGWLALRIALDAGKNAFDKPLFAHSSPIYVEFDGKRIFRKDVAQQLIGEVRGGIEIIEAKGQFRAESERDRLLRAHHDAINRLEQRVTKQKKTGSN